MGRSFSREQRSGGGKGKQPDKQQVAKTGNHRRDRELTPDEEVASLLSKPNPYAPPLSVNKQPLKKAVQEVKAAAKSATATPLAEHLPPESKSVSEDMQQPTRQPVYKDMAAIGKLTSLAKQQALPVVAAKIQQAGYEQAARNEQALVRKQQLESFADGPIHVQQPQPSTPTSQPPASQPTTMPVPAGGDSHHPLPTTTPPTSAPASPPVSPLISRYRQARDPLINVLEEGMLELVMHRPLRGAVKFFDTRPDKMFGFIIVDPLDKTPDELAAMTPKELLALRRKEIFFHYNDVAQANIESDTDGALIPYPVLIERRQLGEDTFNPIYPPPGTRVVFFPITVEGHDRGRRSKAVPWALEAEWDDRQIEINERLTKLAS